MTSVKYKVVDQKNGPKRCKLDGQIRNNNCQI